MSRETPLFKNLLFAIMGLKYLDFIIDKTVTKTLLASMNLKLDWTLFQS